MKIRILAISGVDLSVKNGQGIYGLKTMEALGNVFNSPDYELLVAAPEPIYDITNISISYKFPKKIYRSVFWSVLLQYHLLKCITLFRPNYVIASSKPNLFLLSVAKFFFRYQLILFVEGNAKKNISRILGPLKASIALFSLESLIKSASKIFPAYEDAASWVLSVSSDADIKILPVGVDFSVLPDLPVRKCDYPTARLDIGYVGSFRDVHCLDLLVSLALANCNIHLHLIGDGDKLASIKQACSDLLVDRVIFYGLVEQKDLGEIVSNLHIMWGYTDPMHWGVPIKVYESLAMNRPVICSRRPEFNFIEIKGFGVVVGEISLSDLSLKIESFVEIWARSNLKPRVYIKDRFNWNNFGAACLNVVKND